MWKKCEQAINNRFIIVEIWKLYGKRMLFIWHQLYNMTCVVITVKKLLSFYYLLKTQTHTQDALHRRPLSSRTHNSEERAPAREMRLMTWESRPKWLFHGWRDAWLQFNFSLPSKSRRSAFRRFQNRKYATSCMFAIAVCHREQIFIQETGRSSFTFAIIDLLSFLIGWPTAHRRTWDALAYLHTASRN